MLETHILSIRNFNFVTFCQYEMLETHILSIRNVRNSHFVNTNLINSSFSLSSSYFLSMFLSLHTDVQWVAMYPNVSKTQKTQKNQKNQKYQKKCQKVLKTA